MNTTELKNLIKDSPNHKTWKNEHGNTVYSGHSDAHYCGDDSRYRYDELLLSKGKNWKQFDTDQDAWYFGVWVNIDEYSTFTYAEGDIILVICNDRAHMKAELDHAEQFYGAPPPMAISFDLDGTRTEFFDKRPAIRYP